VALISDAITFVELVVEEVVEFALFACAVTMKPPMTAAHAVISSNANAKFFRSIFCRLRLLSEKTTGSIFY